MVKQLLGYVIAFVAALAGEAGAASGDAQVVRAWFEDEAALREVSPWLGHARIDRGKGLMQLEADPWLRSRLIAAGFRVEIDAEGTRAMHESSRLMARQKSIPGYACYRTVEEAAARLDALQAQHPALVEVIELGPSWMASQGLGGYPLRAVRLTNQAFPGPKPILFVLGSIHAREFTPAELLLRFAEELVRGHGQDADATWILDRHEVQIVVHANPDGRKRAEAGLLWRKNVNNGFCSNSNSRGIDLNRNFPFVWGEYGGSSGSACNDTYRGPAAGSEPETQAIVDHVREIYADRRGDGLAAAAPDDTTGIFIDVHSYSQLVLWPWGFIETPAPNATALGVLGRRLAGFNGYTAEAAIGLYPTDGTTDDFAYGELGVASYAFELGTAFFESCASFENNVLPPNREALRYAARSVAAPYLLPAGPDAQRARVAPDLVLAGDPAYFEVELDDERQQTNLTDASGPVPAVQAIASGEAYLGSAPWDAGAVPIPMAPVDGIFDAPRESAFAMLDTTALAPGRHLVYAQGRDAAGNDGPVGAAFVEVVAPEDAATISGTVSGVVDGTPLQAEIRNGDYVTTSDPGDGRYARLVRAGTFALEVSAPGYESEIRTGLAIDPGESQTQDFALYRLCPVLEDAAEVALPSPFAPQSPWVLRNGAGRDGGAAWMQSASGSYANNVNASLTSGVLDLQGYTSVGLRFEQRCNTEASWDFGIVEVSQNGGSSWIEVFRCDGETGWRTVELDLPQLDGVAQVRLRFRFLSDPGVVAPGWAVDDIVLSAGGEECRASQVPDVAIDAFTATPAQIVEGDGASLSWATSHADACRIDNDLDAGSIPIPVLQLEAGELAIAPLADTVYTLACEGEGGPVTREAAVEVLPRVRILEFTSGANPLIPGQGTSLQWSTLHASQCAITNDLDAVTLAIGAAEAGSGTREVIPAANVTYALQCEGAGGPVTELTAITLGPEQPQLFSDGFETTP
jgi:carboxypeptidase T